MLIIFKDRFESVIDTITDDFIPRVGDTVNLNSEIYTVHTVEWVYFKHGEKLLSSVIIYLDNSNEKE